MQARWLMASLLLVTAFAGCVDGDEPNDPNGGTGNGGSTDLPYGGATDDSHRSHLDPVPESYLPDTITGLEHLVDAVENGTYQAIANDDILYVASGAGLRIVDIADPANPVVLAEDIIDTQSRDVDLLFHPNGNLYAVLADGGENGIRLVDVTDPTDPFFVSKSSKCAHNIAVVPGTTLVYNSYSLCHLFDMVPGGDLAKFTIVDFADPANPVETHFQFPPVAQTVTGVPRAVTSTACHHTTFQMDRELAYCAGVTQTLIMDIQDPADPQIIQVIDWPGINIHHAVWPAHGGDLLILGDEMAGVIAPTPTCSEVYSNPTSALWFIDTSDLGLPTPVGYFQADHYEAINQDVISGLPGTAGSLYCSTHFGTLMEDRDLFVLGWYTAGTVMLDFSNPAAPTQIGEWHPGGLISTTDSLYYKGHVYSIGTHGVDILKVI